MIACFTGKKIVAVARTPPVGSVRTSITTGSAARLHPDQPSTRQPKTTTTRHIMPQVYRPGENLASTNRLLKTIISCETGGMSGTGQTKWEPPLFTSRFSRMSRASRPTVCATMRHNDTLALLAAHAHRPVECCRNGPRATYGRFTRHDRTVLQFRHGKRRGLAKLSRP